MWVKDSMKQIIQSRRSGKLAIKQVPKPRLKPGYLLVQTAASLISTGTERKEITFAKKNLLAKANSRPDLVKKVLKKVKKDGFRQAFHSVMARLDEPLPLGYSAAGKIIELGSHSELLERRGKYADMFQAWKTAVDQ